MNDLTRQSDRVLEDARRLRDDNRAGGRHRRSSSIGQGSQAIKRANWTLRIRNIVIALFTILVAAGIAGAMFDGIGFFGVMSVLVAAIVATALFSSFPKVKVPKRADLTKGDVRTMVGRTEIWLEHQRPALPAPAVKVVEDMGVQLDALGLQLEAIDQQHPAAQEVRKLVGDVLPETIDAYRRIPQNLRQEKRAGATPDEQLTESLTRISREIDHVTRQLAEGSLDDLAIKTRYLEYRYGENEQTSKES
ncbi:hypothetical protein U4960_04440 [Altererythrobacter sp. H2]|uniref:hypothetical protein n=1 Tax=Altererythrobacter sp. H2 TaxID=3108391 RepID=UPI002B4C06FA|nr:hypothetical protein [Altererythrobacter sp. H2]WRK96578.1 hypothetical protein U4960_04440 [Altererythrobacter sp. H2]